MFRGGQATTRSNAQQVRIVTYNIQFGQRFRQALDEIQTSLELQDTDDFLLQEVHERAVEFLAAGLGCEYVYHPVSVHPGRNKNFGNAVLVRGTIHDYRRTLTRHSNWINGQRRAATIAHISVRGHQMTVVSAHTGTAVMGLRRRMDQVEDILDALDDVQGPVVIGGDFNVISDSENDMLSRVFTKGGMTLLSEDATRTASLHFGLRGTLDLIYGRGVRSLASGVVRDTNASDHCPVWVVVEIDD